MEQVPGEINVILSRKLPPLGHKLLFDLVLSTNISSFWTSQVLGVWPNSMYLWGKRKQGFQSQLVFLCSTLNFLWIQQKPKYFVSRTKQNECTSSFKKCLYQTHVSLEINFDLTFWIMFVKMRSRLSCCRSFTDMQQENKCSSFTDL